MKYELPRVHPFHERKSWHGTLWTLDETPTKEFTEDDLDTVLWSFDSGDDWDGEVACICLLKDGRYISWETNWRPTGNGFCEDAYGGDADILCSSTYQTAATLGLSDEHRENALKESD